MNVMKRLMWVSVIVMVCASVFAIGVVVGVQAQDNRSRLDPLPSGAPYQPNTIELSLNQLYEQAIQSVVNISVVKANAFGEGSGFVIDTDGHIVTNNHVAEGAQYIEVTFADGTIREASVVGRDPDSDLAVIKIDPSGLTLYPVTLADSDQVFVGQQVLAIGNPFGQSFTLTTGIVSALDRSLTAESNFSIPEVIQTDAAINPGNSGGPLLDMSGNVIGVNTAINTESGSSSGVSFSVPSNTVRRVVPYLIQYGSYEHTWLGITGNTLRPEQIEAMNLPADTKGVLVGDLQRGGPAADAGVRGSSNEIRTSLGRLSISGDVITAINGTPVASMSDLVSFLDTTQPGDVVIVTIIRDGATQNIEITLEARP
ncbi:MAG: trypsin-like peptidase domain-containing protein [Anaerolineae bacterium]|nr:trypsin-like peptidase domain-containing protein [Anaerolineae bacterium]